MSMESEEEQGLERRAIASRARLFETIDALERRGARFVATAREIRHVFTLVIDGVAVVGAVASLLSLARAATRGRRHYPALPAHRGDSPGATGTFLRVAALALFAGVAYVARRRLAAHPHVPAPPRSRSPRLRAVS